MDLSHLSQLLYATFSSSDSSLRLKAENQLLSLQENYPLFITSLYQITKNNENFQTSPDKKSEIKQIKKSATLYLKRMLQTLLQEEEETLPLSHPHAQQNEKKMKFNNNLGGCYDKQDIKSSGNVRKDGQSFGSQSEPCEKYENESEKMERINNNLEAKPFDNYENESLCRKLPYNIKNLDEIRKSFFHMVVEGLFEEGISRKDKVQFQIMLHMLLIDEMGGRFKEEILGVVKERLDMLDRLKMNEVAAVMLLVKSILGSLNLAVDINAFYNQIAPGMSYLGRMILTFFENKNFEFVQLLSR